jgi:hypothetical protein
MTERLKLQENRRYVFFTSKDEEFFILVKKLINFTRDGWYRHECILEHEFYDKECYLMHDNIYYPRWTPILCLTYDTVKHSVRDTTKIISEEEYLREKFATMKNAAAAV